MAKLSQHTKDVIEWFIYWYFPEGVQVEMWSASNYYEVLRKVVELQLRRSSYTHVPFSIDTREVVERTVK